MKYFLPERLDFALTCGLVRAALFNCGGRQRRSQGGCWRGSSTPLSDQNIDVYFL